MADRGRSAPSAHDVLLLVGIVTGMAGWCLLAAALFAPATMPQPIQPALVSAQAIHPAELTWQRRPEPSLADDAPPMSTEEPTIHLWRCDAALSAILMTLKIAPAAERERQATLAELPSPILMTPEPAPGRLSSDLSLALRAACSPVLAQSGPR